MPTQLRLARPAPIASILLGRHLDRTGDVDGAIRSYREAAELDHVGRVKRWRSWLLYMRAATSARRRLPPATAALEREPTNQSARKILGLIYAASTSGADASAEDARLATEHLEQARGTLLPDFQVEVTLARLYLGTSDSDKAIALLEGAARGRARLLGGWTAAGPGV